MAGFYTDKQGRVRPIRGNSGKAAVMAGAVVLGVFASGGGAVPLGGSAVSSEISAVRAGGSQAQLRARKSEGQKAARRGDPDGAWGRLGLRQLRRTPRQQAECLAASYGQVREFFTRHRCTSLERALFVVADDGGNTAAVSVAWVGLAGSGEARRFRTLIDEHGTGDITPLGAPLLDLAEISYTGLRYGSDRDGRNVTVAEAENATGSGFDHDTLDAIAEVAAHLPRI
ncbi:hypothetical protein JOF41_001859 [Saccharothrix coeruleofusca]|uniref:hypothetical protein n=1 Tax=Saccharothrix coeruleofusca TaxID=33919 RepID=UPI001AE6B781|nr:hypothetical protein [Saccharothrix coeruleofusca]MBP2335681.1 hypothetical protein [Saccharothrix coeruleofusca]